MDTYKKIWFLIVAVVLTMGLSSCSSGSDDDEFNSEELGEIVSKLQGNWQFEGGTETVMGMTINFSRSDLMEMKKQMEDAENTKIEVWDDELKFCGNKVNGVRFSIKDNNQLIIDEDDVYDLITIYINSVTSSKLILHEVINMEGFDFTADMEYRKK